MYAFGKPSVWSKELSKTCYLENFIKGRMLKRSSTLNWTAGLVNSGRKIVQRAYDFIRLLF